MADDEDIGVPIDAEDGDEALGGSFRPRAAVTILFRAAMVILVVGVAALAVLSYLGRSSEHAHTPQGVCHGNLHHIAVAMKMYRQDNGGYPPDLHERPVPEGENWYGPDLTKTRSGYGLAALYPDYVQNLSVFRCPFNGIRTPGIGGRNTVCQSYDGEDPAAGPGGNRVTPDHRLYADGRFFGPGARLKYARVWKVRWQGNTASPDPEERRQLIWKYPPPDTVLTWCPYHRHDPKAAQVRPGDRDRIVCLDGSIRRVKSLNESGHGSRAAE